MSSLSAPTILHVFSTFALGGPQRRFSQIALASPDRFRHLIVALDGRLEARSLLNASRNVEFVSPPARAGHLVRRIARFRGLLRAINPSVLVTYNWGAIEWALAGWALPIAHIHVEDGFGPDEANRQLWRRVWFRRIALARSFAIVVPSLTLQRIARNTWKLPARRILYIPNGIELSDVQPPGNTDATRRELHLPAASPVVGWIGGLRREKNVSRLLRALACAATEAHLVIVGDGPDRPQAERESQSLGIAHRICFAGVQTDIQRFLEVFDVLALSSDTEQMPMVILEAMAAGLPIASVEVGDIRAMVSEENRAFIVERSDTALAAALSKLLASENVRRTIGEANRRHVAEHFPLDRMATAYFALFDRAARHSSTGSQVRVARAPPG